MVCQKTQELINYKMAAMKANSYSPELHKDKKYLTIIACHIERKLKEYTLINNLKYLDFANNDIVIINSKNTAFNRNKITTRITNYVEVPNNSKTLDFGKYMFVLQNYDYSKYDYVIFMNDSIVINEPINHFYNIMMKKNVEFYGYNSSSEGRYHYQSYLFGVKSTSVPKLIDFYNKKAGSLSGWQSIVNLIELNLSDIFEIKDCFLDLAKVVENKGKNINYNDELFDLFYKTKLFSITKVKRIKKV
jgi:hypothetical protein